MGSEGKRTKNKETSSTISQDSTGGGASVLEQNDRDGRSRYPNNSKASSSNGKECLKANRC